MKKRGLSQTTPSSVAGDMVPGRKPVLELLSAAPMRIDTVFLQKEAKSSDISQILDACKTHGIRYKFLGKAEIGRMYDGVHQGVLARTFAPGFMELDDLLRTAVDAPLPVAVALDQVQDPGNVGTLARTLYALGGAGLILPKDRSAYLGAAAQKASAGALMRLATSKVVNLARALDDAEEAGFAVYCAEMKEGGLNAFDLRFQFPAVLVLGNEEKGIRPNVAKRCGETAYIPLAGGFDSLNVAQAGGILLAFMSASRAASESA